MSRPFWELAPPRPSRVRQAARTVSPPPARIRVAENQWLPARIVQIPSAGKLAFSSYLPVADLLIRQGNVRFRVASNSMAPRLLPGDLVDLAPVSQEEIQAGDILAAPRDGAIICHQVTRCFDQDGTRWVVLKGARAEVEDPPVPFHQVIGRVVRVRKRSAFWWLKRAWDLERPHWRIRLARSVQRIARAIDFFSLALLRPKELLESNRRFYERDSTIAFYGREEPHLFPFEKQALEHCVEKVGSALVLGSGAGREAIALAGCGWSVVGIEQSSALTRVSRERANRDHPELAIEWHRWDVTQGIPLTSSFDLICLFNTLYNLIPTRKLRVQLLKDCKAHLNPAGLCMLVFCIQRKSPSLLKNWAHGIRRAAGVLLAGNPRLEWGDRWTEEYFMHYFSSMEEVISEACEAGLRVSFENADSPMKILALKNDDRF